MITEGQITTLIHWIKLFSFVACRRYYFDLLFIITVVVIYGKGNVINPSLVPCTRWHDQTLTFDIDKINTKLAALSPVSHKVLHHGWTQTSSYLQVIHFTSHYTTSYSFVLFFLAVYIPRALNTGTCIQKGDLFYSAGTQHGNLHPEGWPILFCGHTTREPTSRRVTYFILRAHTGTSVSRS